ncbi:MAG: glycosyltransferase family 4 protein [Bacteroidetes bacterium]|nr:glycosyltransferase family 4 protein [Bacteroidota bacterium]
MKIGFAARYNPEDKKTWSGISYYTLQQLKKYGEVEIFQYKLPKLLQEWLTTQKSINRRWFQKHTSVEFLTSYANYFSKKLTRELKKRPVDVLFVSASSQMIAYVETDIPVIYMTDATFQQLQGYYPGFSNLARYNVRKGIELDKKAFQKASHCMLASDWNKISAVNDYGINSGKISVAPCGANLDRIPNAEEINFKRNGICNLLFLGVDWERKGGDIALETYRKLKQDGINAHLHIIGCVPPYEIKDSGITVIPYLDKNKDEDFRQLHQIFLQTDCLLLPTRAECAGIVFSEASAYGIPSITTDTGGVSTYVKDGINGFALPHSAAAGSYAEKIGQLFFDQHAFRNLKQSARKYYEEKLNWDHWGYQFQKIAGQLIRL